MPLPLSVQVASKRHRLEQAKKKTDLQTASADLTAQYLDETGDGIIRFAREVLGIDLTDYQSEILQALIVHGKASARGPHGLGKTTMAAIAILYAVTVFPEDVKIVTTASVFRQLKQFLWPEVRKWARRANWLRIGVRMERGKQLLEQSIKMPNGREAFAAAPTDATAIEGAHAKHILYIFDEAKAIPDDVWDAAEGAFSGAGEGTDQRAYALAISTPGNPSGRFYQIHVGARGYEDWYTRHVTLDEAVAAGRISREWVAQRAKQWGTNSAIYKNRVEGEFDTSGEDSVIPLEWVEKAVERWYAVAGKGEGKVAKGVDVARFGGDLTVIAHRVGMVIESLDTYAKQSTMATVGRVIASVGGDKRIPLMVDVIGVGAGVVDRLAEQGYNVTGVNVAEKTDLKTNDGFLGFFNKRSAYWWKMREALDPEGDILLAIPPIEGLQGDLTAPKYEYMSKEGTIKVESKDEIRKRLKRSTDYADAAILAYAADLRPVIGDIRILRKGR